MPKYSKPIPIEEAQAAAISPAAEADRHKRAVAIVKDLSDFERRKLLLGCSRDGLDRIQTALRRMPPPITGRFGDPATTANEISSLSFRQATLQEALRIEDEVLVKQTEALLRIADLNAVDADPDRVELRRVWSDYDKQVRMVSWCQGNKASAFDAKFNQLMTERAEAEEFDDANALRRTDAQLERLVGVACPVLPEAAWAAADQLPEAERLEEYERLAMKYGERNATTNGASSGRRSRRESRPLQALTVR